MQLVLNYFITKPLNEFHNTTLYVDIYICISDSTAPVAPGPAALGVLDVWSS